MLLSLPCIFGTIVSWGPLFYMFFAISSCVICVYVFFLFILVLFSSIGCLGSVITYSCILLDPCCQVLFHMSFLYMSQQKNCVQGHLEQHLTTGVQ
jgi:hypothetical protein